MKSSPAIAGAIRQPASIVLASFFLVQVCQLVLVIAFEKVEFDTFTYYFSKVLLQRFWTPDHKILMSYVQEFLPVGFSKIQLFFAEGQYGRNAANFIMALLGAAYFAFYSRKLFTFFVFFTLCNAAFFYQYTGYKTDVSLAILAIVLAHVVRRPAFSLQITAIAAICCLALSIRWTSGLVVLPAVAIFLWHACTGPAWRFRRTGVDLIAAIIAVAVLANWLDLWAYFETFQKTGSFAPTQTFGMAALGWPNPVLLLKNLLSYALTTTLETLEIVWRSLVHMPRLGWWIETLTLGAKVNVTLIGSQIYTTGSILDPLAMLASVLFLFTRNRFVRTCAIMSLFYYLLSFSIYPYDSTAYRYFLSAQLLSYVPLSFVAKYSWLRWFRRRPRGDRPPLAWAAAGMVATFHLAVSAYCLTRDGDRNLIRIPGVPLAGTVPIKQGTVTYGERDPIFRESPNVRLFRGWQGYQVTYEALEASGANSERVAFFFDSLEDRAHYNYPFLQKRQIANTVFTDIAGIADDKAQIPKAPLVVCFSPRACRLLERSGAFDRVGAYADLLGLWRSRQ